MPPATPRFLLSRFALPVAILGDGVSGQGARALLAALGAAAVTYDADGAPFTAAAATGHSLVVYSPGFAPEHPWLARARAAGCECLGELDFGSLFWRGRVVAITGTNGKTTLTEFLAHALRGVGRPAFATGNVGHSFCRLAAATDGGTPDMTAVCEVSSFQAESLVHLRPAATLWTNLAEDHLERHRGMEAYFSAKAVLAARSASVFAGSSVRAFAAKMGEAVNWVATEAQPSDPRLDGTVFARYPQRENFILAEAWWRAEGLEAAALVKAARSFELGRHRLARVGEIEGVGFWNDSKATNFHAVEAALAHFDRPVLLIAGGRGKGGDLAGFVRRIGPRVRHLFLIGETAAELARASLAAGVSHMACGTLAEAVRAAANTAVAGDQILLSPGFASFDQFRNYEDRGNQFEHLVRDLVPAARS